MKLKFGQINLPKHLVHQVGIPCETFGIPYKFLSNKQAELTKLFKKLLEKWKLVLHLLSLSCLLYSNISMEETLLERNFRTFVDNRQNLREHFHKKKIPTIPMNTYVKHVLLISSKKVTYNQSQNI